MHFTISQLFRLPPSLRSSEGAASKLFTTISISPLLSRSPNAALEKGTAFRRTARRDLNWIFSVQTERVVNKDNTVAIADRLWQLEKSRFRSSLAGCTVTIHEHLNGTISIRYGPHVVGRYTADGN